MHELGRYLQRELDRRGWTVAELARRATVSRQTVYSLVNDTREHMDQTPQRKTVNALSEALGVDPIEILTASAQALGVPVEINPTSDSLDHVSDQQILMELASRLSRSKGQDDESESSSSNTRPSLRAVAPTRDTSEGQKTGAPDDVELELDKLGVTQIHGDDAKKYSAPAEPLAAHFRFETEREKFEREHGERGEDSQDTEGS